MKALSIRSPWWWFILHGGKDIENRDWPTRERGRVYVHASRWWKHGEVVTDLDFCRRVASITPDIGQVTEGMGCVVGSVEIVGCVGSSASPWFFGKHGFVLARPVAFRTPVPCLGALGFFTPSAEVLAACKVQEGVRAEGNLSLFGRESDGGDAGKDGTGSI